MYLKLELGSAKTETQPLLWIQVKSRDEAPDAERTAKVQVPVTREKVQSGEDSIMLLMSCLSSSFEIEPVSAWYAWRNETTYETKLDGKYESDV